MNMNIQKYLLNPAHSQVVAAHSWQNKKRISLVEKYLILINNGWNLYLLDSLYKCTEEPE